MQREFAVSLVDFCKRINNEFQKDNIHMTSLIPLVHRLNELAESVSNIKENIGKTERRVIGDRLFSVAVTLVQIPSKVSQTVIGAGNNLVPFSSLAGESFEKK